MLRLRARCGLVSFLPVRGRGLRHAREGGQPPNTGCAHPPGVALRLGLAACPGAAAVCHPEGRAADPLLLVWPASLHRAALPQNGVQ